MTGPTRTELVEQQREVDKKVTYSLFRCPCGCDHYDEVSHNIYLDQREKVAADYEALEVRVAVFVKQVEMVARDGLTSQWSGHTLREALAAFNDQPTRRAGQKNDGSEPAP